MDRLAEILADMIRSALTYEETHRPRDLQDELTVYADAYTLASHRHESGGCPNDSCDCDEKQEPDHHV
jgi:hypothetical protein